MSSITIDLEMKVTEIMTENLISVDPNTSMLKIQEIFEKESFHHLPVLDDQRQPVGMISKNDYHKLQHHFTLMNIKDAEIYNQRFFKSLIAKDIMSKKLISAPASTTIGEALKMFHDNKYHSIIVVGDGECVGIVTPYDFIEVLSEIKS